LNEKIKDDISSKRMDSGQHRKEKKMSKSAWSTSWEGRKDMLTKPKKRGSKRA
jgi:hypothetical protein